LALRSIDDTASRAGAWSPPVYDAVLYEAPSWLLASGLI
jgi:hypothetical protein